MILNLCVNLSKTSFKYIEYVFLLIISYFKVQKADFISFFNNEKRKTKKKKINFFIKLQLKLYK